MATNIRTVLSTFLMINYVCGLRIVEFPVRHPIGWFSLSYYLLLWSIYCFLLMNTVISRMPEYCELYKFSVLLDVFTILFSTMFAIYYDKKFKSCLERLTIVDETLGKLGTTTDYQKLNKGIKMTIAIWTVLYLIIDYFESIWWHPIYGVAIGTYIPVLIHYTSHVNTMSDLMFTYILGYIELKFDQVNEQLYELADSEFLDHDKVKSAWERSGLHRSKFPNALGNKYITWIVIHLHSELRKISREINSIYEIEMTVKMACYFGLIAQVCHEIFRSLFTQDKNMFQNNIRVGLAFCWFFVYFFRLFLINYACARASAKANATGDFIKRISYSIRDAEIRENIAQLLLQLTQAPLKFCGLGLFQFGFKFLRRYSESILTVLIILVQTNSDRNILFKHK